MAAYFFDSSALAKYYHSEIGTPFVDQLIRASGTHVRISRLTVVEMLSVFAVKVRTQFLTRQAATILGQQFKQDLISKRLEVFEVAEAQFESAEVLPQKYGFNLRLRALDALQLAVALELQSSGLADYFVCADKTLCQLAAMEGLSVLDPEKP